MFTKYFSGTITAIFFKIVNKSNVNTKGATKNDLTSVIYFLFTDVDVVPVGYTVSFFTKVKFSQRPE